MKKNSGEIDFVVLWVDGNDPLWRKEKASYSAKGDDSEQRYRDWDIFQYWFRGVEKFAPWVRRVHLVTWGHLPEWLNTDNPKLNIVKHSDYLPQEYLPTFNSHTLELNLHRIDGLSDNFVYFNDDTLLIDRTTPEDFFIDGKPVDMLALQPVVANPDSPEMSYILLNNSMLMSKYFNKRECMKRMPGKFFRIGYPLMYFGYNVLETVFPMFTGFYEAHCPAPLMKKTYDALWGKEYDFLNEVCSHKFRSSGDVSQYVLREWQKLSGEFVPRNIHRKYCYIDVTAKNAADIIRRQKRRMVCINDSYKDFDFSTKKDEIRAALDSVLPGESSFEK